MTLQCPEGELRANILASEGSCSYCDCPALVMSCWTQVDRRMTQLFRQPTSPGPSPWAQAQLSGLRTAAVGLLRDLGRPAIADRAVWLPNEPSALAPPCCMHLRCHVSGLHVVG